MNEFYESLSTIELIYWSVAIIGSVIFTVIFILTFIGGDADMEADSGDFSSDDGGIGFQFFTLKNVVAFFTIFGWTGLVCIDNQLSHIITLLISSVSGLIMMVLTSLLFLWMSKLTHSGTLKIKNAVGVIGEVYLPIGANRSKIGKIQINVQGSLRELDAITDDDEDLKTTSIVKVIEVVSAELLLVKKITN